MGTWSVCGVATAVDEPGAHGSGYEGWNAAAFAGLYEAHVEQIHRYIRVRVGNVTLPDDLTSMVFLRAWEAFGRYRLLPGRPFVAWLFAIAHNLVVDHYRASRRELVGVDLDRHTDSLADPEACTLRADLRRELQSALDHLRPDQRRIVSLRLIEGLSYDEISALTGKKAGALRVACSRALTRLRQELDRRGMQAA